jgi:hypothetical protein
MIQKKPLAGRKVEVTFRMPPLDDVVELYLCGDFNGWQVRGVPLSLESDGTWVGKLVLDAGKSYRFRYHDNHDCWHTDYEADSYVTNEYGTDDSVLDLTIAAKEPSKAKATKKSATKKAATKKSATKKAATPKGNQRDSRKTAGGRRAKAKR